MDTYATDRQKRVAAKAIIRTEDGCLLLVKDGWKENWSFPGGVVQLNESPLEGLYREISEETGLTPTIHHLLGVAFRCDEKKESLTLTFSATLPREVIERDFIAQDGEVVEWKLATVDEALTLLEDITAAVLPQNLSRWDNPVLYSENGRIELS